MAFTNDFNNSKAVSSLWLALFGPAMLVRRKMKRFPSIDLGRCNECMGCVEVAPHIFRYNTSIGYMEVIDLASYPEADVEEAIKNCPEDCISWENKLL